MLIDFIYIAITIIICIIIKPYKYVIIPKEQNHSIDVNMELGMMKNEDYENNEKDSLISLFTHFRPIFRFSILNKVF